MRKYQAKNIWEVSGACVEKQRKFGKVKGYLRNFGKVKGYLAKIAFSQGTLPCLAKWLSLCLCSCFHLKFKPVNFQNPCFNLSK